MSFDFKSCFWDPHDDGVNTLLTHVSQGIRSLDTLEQFFKAKSDVEKDYTRRLGAINQKLDKDLNNHPDFGKLGATLHTLLSTEKIKAQSHSKQSEVIFRTMYDDTKLFSCKLQARYTTLSGKIEKLRLDKYNKRKGCEELSRRLEDSKVRARDLHLNLNNVIGSKRVEQTEKELAKWESNVQEFTSQLNVLRREYKASQKYWLKEWADITDQLQEMENARISFLQSKMQSFAEICMETSIVEQSKMEHLNTELATFTAMDDITDFSSKFGTGRLKEKTSNRKATDSSNVFERSRKHAPPNVLEHSQQSVNRSSYMDNIRKLSNQLQQTSLNKHQKSHTSATAPEINEYNTARRDSAYQPHMASYQSDMADHRLSVIDSSRIKSIDSSTDMRPKHIENEIQKYNTIPHVKNRVTSPTSISTSESSSNPTDFTTHLKKRSSLESMSTSVSSMASSIDETQRFAKSWNSTNRKRKSMSQMSMGNHTSETQIASIPTGKDFARDSTSHDSQVRQGSTSTILVNAAMGNRSELSRPASSLMERSKVVSSDKPLERSSRRKSMVLESSQHPIEDALYEMERLQGGVQKNSQMGRVKDNGIIVTLPLVTRTGEKVIKYAKALYPLRDNGASEVINFDKNDYLLITETINDDWFMGEVYDNETIEHEHRFGLIPFNFIEILT